MGSVEMHGGCGHPTMTVTECCVNDVCATNQVMNRQGSLHQVGRGGVAWRADGLYRYRAGGRGGEKEREECGAARCGAVRCGARIADKMSDSRKRSSM